MSKRSKGWAFTKKVTLPFTKIEVEITMPSWAARTQAYDSAVAMKREGEDFIVAKLMLLSCATFDGEPLDMEDIDDLPVRDAGHLFAQFMDWEAENEEAKNA